jgi:hypothetical protein
MTSSYSPSAEGRAMAEKVERLHAINAELLAALEKIVELAHYPDESIARAAIAAARKEG